MKYISSRGFLTSTAKVLPPYRGIVDEYVEYLRHDRALADHAGWPNAARSGDRRNHSEAFLASHYPVGIRHAVNSSTFWLLCGCYFVCG